MKKLRNWHSREELLNIVHGGQAPLQLNDINTSAINDKPSSYLLHQVTW